MTSAGERFPIVADGQHREKALWLDAAGASATVAASRVIYRKKVNYIFRRGPLSNRGLVIEIPVTT